jgi:hypothetical protein
MFDDQVKYLGGRGRQWFLVVQSGLHVEYNTILEGVSFLLK